MDREITHLLRFHQSQPTLARTQQPKPKPSVGLKADNIVYLSFELGKLMLVGLFGWPLVDRAEFGHVLLDKRLGLGLDRLGDDELFH